MTTLLASLSSHQALSCRASLTLRKLMQVRQERLKLLAMLEADFLSRTEGNTRVNDGGGGGRGGGAHQPPPPEMRGTEANPGGLLSPRLQSVLRSSPPQNSQGASVQMQDAASARGGEHGAGGGSGIGGSTRQAASAGLTIARQGDTPVSDDSLSPLVGKPMQSPPPPGHNSCETVEGYMASRSAGSVAAVHTPSAQAQLPTTVPRQSSQHMPALVSGAHKIDMPTLAQNDKSGYVAVGQSARQSAPPADVRSGALFVPEMIATAHGTSSSGAAGGAGRHGIGLYPQPAKYINSFSGLRGVLQPAGMQPQPVPPPPQHQHPASSNVPQHEAPAKSMPMQASGGWGSGLFPSSFAPQRGAGAYYRQQGEHQKRDTGGVRYGSGSMPWLQHQVAEAGARGGSLGAGSGKGSAGSADGRWISAGSGAAGGFSLELYPTLRTGMC